MASLPPTEPTQQGGRSVPVGGMSPSRVAPSTQAGVPALARRQEAAPQLTAPHSGGPSDPRWVGQGTHIVPTAASFSPVAPTVRDRSFKSRSK